MAKEVSSKDLQKVIPDLSHLDDKTQREITSSFQRVYELHSLAIKELRDEFESKLSTTQTQTNDLVNGFATNLIGDVSDNVLSTLNQTHEITVDELPSIPTTKISGVFDKTQVPSDIVYSTFVQVATGDIPITGTIVIKDKLGNSITIPYI